MRVVYALPAGEVSVEAVRRHYFTRDLAAANLRIITDAYTAAFEGSEQAGAQLPSGTVARHFAPYDRESVLANERRIIASSQQEGAVYWRGLLAEEQVALGKISPSYVHGRRGRIHGERPNAYVNDVLVTPRLQKQRIGSAMLHAMLRYSSAYEPDARVVVDLFKDSVLEDKIRGIGFREVTGAAITPMHIGGIVLPRVRYETDADHDLSTTVRALESAEPRLSGHRLG